MMVAQGIEIGDQVTVTLGRGEGAPVQCSGQLVGFDFDQTGVVRLLINGKRYRFHKVELVERAAPARRALPLERHRSDAKRLAEPSAGPNPRRGF